LGANTPIKELLKYISDTKPDIIVISISIAFSIHTLVDLVDELTNNFSNTKIILGGQAFRWGGKEMFDKYPNVEIITTLSQLEDKYLSKTNYEAR
jgi:cobalamin-dependent methionine synthase I